MVVYTSRELLKQAKWYAEYCLDPMCAVEEINFMVGCRLFIERLDAELAKPVLKVKPNICEMCGHISTANN